MNIDTFAKEGAAAFDGEKNFIRADDHDFLRTNEMTYQSPRVLPLNKFLGMMQTKVDRAIATGLSTRPLADTI